MSLAHEFPDTRRGEILLGFYLRAGLWIDGIEILTSLGRRSGVYGNARGGSGCVTSASFLSLLPERADNLLRIDTLYCHLGGTALQVFQVHVGNG